MALSVDTPRVYELGNINDVPVKASTKIYEGAAVGMTSGYARGLTAGDDFAGFAQRQADNSAVATDGAINCKVISKGLIELTISGVAVTDIGQPVYASADGTFTLTQSTNSYIGLVYRYVTTDTAVVAFCAHSQNDGPAAAGGTLAAGKFLVGNAFNVAAERTISGDITFNNSGVAAIGSDKILTAMISDLTVTYGKLTSTAINSIVSLMTSKVTSHVSSSAH